MTGGFIDNKRSSLTEMMTDNKRWEIIPTARLPVPLVESAALTINNKVYIFGKRSLVVAQSIGCLKGGNGGRDGLRWTALKYFLSQKRDFTESRKTGGETDGQSECLSCFEQLKNEDQMSSLLLRPLLLFLDK